MGKTIAMLLVLVAIIVAVLAEILPDANMVIVLRVESFFQAMLPILAVGALLKFIFCHHQKCSDK